MPTRSIALKLFIPHRAEAPDAVRALWATHRAVNEAARYYESKLLLLRGKEYLTEADEDDKKLGKPQDKTKGQRRDKANNEKPVDAESVRAQALALTRSAQINNIGDT